MLILFETKNFIAYLKSLLNFNLSLLIFITNFIILYFMAETAKKCKKILIIINEKSMNAVNSKRYSFNLENKRKFFAYD